MTDELTKKLNKKITKLLTDKVNEYILNIFETDPEIYLNLDDDVIIKDFKIWIPNK